MMFEKRLRLAAVKADTVRMENVSKLNEVEWDFSPRFQRKMKWIIKRADHPVQFALQQIASVVLVILLSAAIWLSVDTDARAEFFAWVRERWMEGYHYFIGRESLAEGKTGSCRLGWVPEGYTEQTVLERVNSTIVVYTDKNGDKIQLIYSERTKNTDFYVQSDTSEMTNVAIGDSTADLYTGNTTDISNTLVWTKGEFLYILDAFLPPADLVKMAENIID